MSFLEFLNFFLQFISVKKTVKYTLHLKAEKMFTLSLERFQLKNEQKKVQFFSKIPLQIRHKNVLNHLIRSKQRGYYFQQQNTTFQICRKKNAQSEMDQNQLYLEQLLSILQTLNLQNNHDPKKFDLSREFIYITIIVIYLDWQGESDGKMNPRQSWNVQQDQFLRTLVLKSEKLDWNSISHKINEFFPAKDRTSKQCRQRYINYSCFTENNTLSEWRPEDINILYEQFNKWGTSWIKISRSLPGKSQNSIKNKFYGGLRKVVRRINGVGKKQFKKMKKKIRYESVVRIIEAAECFQNLQNELREESLYLRQKIFSIIKSKQQQFSDIEIAKLIEDMNRFNLATRSFRSRKVKRINEELNDITIQNHSNVQQLGSKGQVINNLLSKTSSTLQMSPINFLEAEKEIVNSKEFNQIKKLQQNQQLQWNNNQYLSPNMAENQQIYQENNYNDISMYFLHPLSQICSPPFQDYHLF